VDMSLGCDQCCDDPTLAECAPCSPFFHCCGDEPPPLPPPPAPPPPSPPLPLASATDYPGCNEKDMAGDFDHNGAPTLGDAVFVAMARLELGTSGLLVIECMGGDFDEDGSFTMNDAARVAEAQFQIANLPWETPVASSQGRRLIDPLATRRQLQPSHVGMYATKEPAAHQMDVHVTGGPHHSSSGALSDGHWKALSVKFTGGTISSVEMKHGSPGQVTAQFGGLMFQAADLSGGSHSWPAGLAATVTFDAATDVSAIEIDYHTSDTYIIQNGDGSCVPARGAPCATRPAIYPSKDSTPPSAAVAAAGPAVGNGSGLTAGPGAGTARPEVGAGSALTADRDHPLAEQPVQPVHELLGPPHSAPHHLWARMSTAVPSFPSVALSLIIMAGLVSMLLMLLLMLLLIWCVGHCSAAATVPAAKDAGAASGANDIGETGRGTQAFEKALAHRQEAAGAMLEP